MAGDFHHNMKGQVSPPPSASDADSLVQTYTYMQSQN